MKIKHILLLGINTILIQVAISQTVNSAIDVGMYDLLGSGRYVGMGGAFTSVGGDLSSIKLNPAAAGVKRKNEWAVSGDFSLMNYKSDANGQQTSTNENRFSIPDITYTTVSRTDDLHWKTINFSVGIQRVNNLNKSINFGGEGRFKSYLNKLKEQAQEYKDQGKPLDPNSVLYQAYQTILIDLNQKDQYYSMLEQDGQEFEYEYTSNGRVYDMFISASSAYKNKLFIGATLAFPIINQSTYSKLTEFNFLYPKTDLVLDSITTQLESAHFENKHNVTGSGIVGKFGVIYKLDKNIRIGASYHTPVYYSLEDDFSYRTTAYFKGFNTQRITQGGFAYFNMVTPARYNLGMSYIFGKKGLISLDYNYTDLSTTKYIVPNTDVNYEYFYGDNTNTDRGVNDFLADDYKGSHTIKLGGEINMKPFRIRGGAVIQTSPYKHNNSLQSSTVTAGIGYSKREFYIDLGLAYNQSEEEVNLNAYDGPEGNSSEKYRQTQIIITTGFKLK